MDLTSLRRKAMALGVDRRIVAGMGKAELIVAIQTAEGNTPCFGTKASSCSQSKCCWMSDCYAEARRMSARSEPTWAT